MSRIFGLVADVEGILSSYGCRGYSGLLRMSRVFGLVADVDGIRSSCGFRG